MTTFSDIEVTCAVCGKTSAQQALTSTSTFGAPDLDTRPAELQRSTIWLWVQRCPSCGLCAPTLVEGSPAVTETVESEGYRSQLASPDYPDLANAFLCCALVEAADGDIAAAGWSALHAAWVCDDEGREDSARSARERAGNLFLTALAREQQFAEDRASEHAILADVLRRAGKLEESLVETENGLASGPHDFVRQVLEFERTLIEERDVSCHTVDEAVTASGRSSD